MKVRLTKDGKWYKVNTEKLNPYFFIIFTEDGERAIRTNDHNILDIKNDIRQNYHYIDYNIDYNLDTLDYRQDDVMNIPNNEVEIVERKGKLIFETRPQYCGKCSDVNQIKSPELVTQTSIFSGDNKEEKTNYGVCKRGICKYGLGQYKPRAYSKLASVILPEGKKYLFIEKEELETLVKNTLKQAYKDITSNTDELELLELDCLRYNSVTIGDKHIIFFDYDLSSSSFKLKFKDGNKLNWSLYYLDTNIEPSSRLAPLKKHFNELIIILEARAMTLNEYVDKYNIYI